MPTPPDKLCLCQKCFTTTCREKGKRNIHWDGVRNTCSSYVSKEQLDKKEKEEAVTQEFDLDYYMKYLSGIPWGF